MKYRLVGSALQSFTMKSSTLMFGLSIQLIPINVQMCTIKVQITTTVVSNKENRSRRMYGSMEEMHRSRDWAVSYKVERKTLRERKLWQIRRNDSNHKQQYGKDKTGKKTRNKQTPITWQDTTANTNVWNLMLFTV